jgi:DNA-directed RNA polymerase specialized sigma24 family protein
LNGDAEATRSLVADLTPIVQRRAAQALRRWRVYRSTPSNSSEDVQDLTQEILLMLFADGARVLRTWNPARGLSLQNFVGLAAEKEVANWLESRRMRPSGDRLTEAELADDAALVVPSPEEAAAARDLIWRVMARAREELTPYGRGLLEMLLIEDCDVAEACARTGMSRNAIYAWRSRLHKLARRIADTISG